MASATACPAESVLAGFVDRDLAEAVADEVRDHLDECADCRASVLAFVRVAHGSEPARIPDSLVALSAGTTLGHFAVGDRIGAGGMGVVHAARDLTLDREVAIKVLRADGPAAGDRLLGEARTLARIRHEAVLTVYEAGQVEGVVFIAMERIAGTTLRAHLAVRRPLAEVLSLFQRAGHGLAAAHAHGVVHRDFKPANVLLEVDAGQVRRVLVADFGLATHASETVAAGGTHAYIAPEQRAGAAADARADVYSFAASVREALSQLPRARIPRQLDRLLTGALAADPAERPGLPRLLAALAPRRTSTPWVAVGALLATALGIVAVVVAAVSSHHPSAAAERCDAGMTWDPVAWRAAAAAVPHWVQARVLAVMAERVGEVAGLAPQACLGPAPERHAWVSCRARQAGTEAATIAALSVRWPSYGRLDEALALPWPSTCQSRAAALEAVLEPTGDLDRASLAAARASLDHLRLARLADRPVADRVAVRAVLAMQAPTVRDRLAVPLALEDASGLTGERRTAALEGAVALAERTGDLVGSADAWLALATVRVMEPPDEATVQRDFEQAGWAIERLGTPPELQVDWLGLATSRAWQHSDAVGARGYAARARALAGSSPTQRRSALHALVAAAGASADFATQRIALEELLADPVLAEPGSALVAHSTYFSYAQCLYQLGDQPAALAAIDRAARLGDTAGIDGPARVEVLVTRASIELELGHPELSVGLLADAEALLAVDPDDRVLGMLFALRANVLLARHELAGAVTAAEASARLLERRMGETSEEFLYALATVAELALQRGDLERAATAATRVEATTRATFGAADPRSAYAAYRLGTVLVARGEREQARALFTGASASLAAAHDTTPEAAEPLGALARITADPRGSRELAERALAAWHDEPAWRDQYRDLAAWLASHPRGGR